jgi:hypothetical protein
MGKKKQHIWKRTEMHTKFLVVTPYKRRPLGRPRSRQYNRIKMYLKKTAVRECDMDWIHLAHDRDHRWAPVNTVMNLRVSYTGQVLQ